MFIYARESDGAEARLHVGLGMIPMPLPQPARAIQGLNITESRAHGSL